MLVRVRSDVGLQFGFVRGIGEHGCLLEVKTPPRLGSNVWVQFEGIEGSRQTERERELQGYAQHAMLWRFGRDGTRVRRLVIKWSSGLGG